MPTPAGYACALAAFTRATSISNATFTPTLAFAFGFDAYSTVYSDATYSSMAEDSRFGTKYAMVYATGSLSRLRTASPNKWQR